MWGLELCCLASGKRNERASEGLGCKCWENFGRKCWAEPVCRYFQFTISHLRAILGMVQITAGGAKNAVE